VTGHFHCTETFRFNVKYNRNNIVTCARKSDPTEPIAVVTETTATFLVFLFVHLTVGRLHFASAVGFGSHTDKLQDSEGNVKSLFNPASAYLNPSHPSHTYVKCRRRCCRTRIFILSLFRKFLNHVSIQINGRECLSAIPVHEAKINT